MRYTLEELEVMPINLLRNIDIQTKEEEELVQRVWNKRQLDLPIDIDLTIRSSETDNMTPEKEAELQARIDAEKAAKRAELGVPGEEVSSETPVDSSEETVSVDESVVVSEEATEESPSEEVKERFCEYCEAKGPVKHQKNCTRPK